MCGEHGRGRAVGDDPAAGLEYDHAIDQRQRIRDAMFDEYERCLSAGNDAAHALAYERGAGRVEVGGRLVEQQQRRAQRDRAGQRQSLLFASGQRRRRSVAWIAETGGGQRFIDKRPDPRARHATVLQPERDVVAGAGHDEVGLRILEDDADLAPGGAGIHAAHRDAALLLAGVFGEQAGERGEQRALARPGWAEQQHPLAAREPQVHTAYGPGLAARVPPAEAAQLDVRSRCVRGQTATRSRPDGNRSSAPVCASALVST